MDPLLVRILCGIIGVALLMLIVKRRRARQQQ